MVTVGSPPVRLASSVTTNRSVLVNVVSPLPVVTIWVPLSDPRSLLSTTVTVIAAAVGFWNVTSSRIVADDGAANNSVDTFSPATACVG